MKNLNLGYNQLSDVNCLEVLTKLETLDLSRNLLSGSFDFSMVGMENLESANFSNNQISDIAYFTNQFKFLAKAHNMEVEEYVLSEYCPKVSFQYQTLTLELTVVLEGQFITVDLPAIFEQAPGLGERLATVTIEGNNGNSYSTDGLAYGTTCSIAYTIVENATEEPDDPDTPVDPDEPVNPDDPDTPVNPGDETEITYGYRVEDGYVYVNTPEIEVSEFVNNLIEEDGYSINVVNSDQAIGDYISTGAVVTIDTAQGEEVDILEIVVLGDVNGDGEVDALDSGIIKNVINDTTSLVGSYNDAADVNNDGDIDSLDSLLVLQYRADKISSF